MPSVPVEEVHRVLSGGLRGSRFGQSSEGSRRAHHVRMLSRLLVSEARPEPVPLGLPAVPSQPRARGMEEAARRLRITLRYTIIAIDQMAIATPIPMRRPLTVPPRLLRLRATHPIRS
jgi:hypothetical protein